MSDCDVAALTQSKKMDEKKMKLDFPKPGVEEQRVNSGHSWPILDL